MRRQKPTVVQTPPCLSDQDQPQSSNQSYCSLFFEYLKTIIYHVGGVFLSFTFLLIAGQLVALLFVFAIHFARYLDTFTGPYFTLAMQAIEQMFHVQHQRHIPSNEAFTVYPCEMEGCDGFSVSMSRLQEMYEHNE